MRSIHRYNDFIKSHIEVDVTEYFTRAVYLWIVPNVKAAFVILFLNFQNVKRQIHPFRFVCSQSCEPEKKPL